MKDEKLIKDTLCKNQTFNKTNKNMEIYIFYYFSYQNIPPTNKAKWNLLKNKKQEMKNQTSFFFVENKNFPGIFFLLFFVTCFLGNFFYWLLKNKEMKKFCLVENSANETLFLTTV